MRILGIDPDMPSSASARWIIPETLFTTLQYGAITTKAHTTLRTDYLKFR